LVSERNAGRIAGKHLELYMFNELLIEADNKKKLMKAIKKN
jgi:hypothetical protein